MHICSHRHSLFSSPNILTKTKIFLPTKSLSLSKASRNCCAFGRLITMVTTPQGSFSRKPTHSSNAFREKSSEFMLRISSPNLKGRITKSLTNLVQYYDKLWINYNHSFRKISDRATLFQRCILVEKKGSQSQQRDIEVVSTLF